MKPWADLTSPERLDAVLVAIAELGGEWKDATAASIATRVQRSHTMERPRGGNHGRGNVLRAMSLATRVTPSLTALRKRGLITFTKRMDGRSGSADLLTEAGEAKVLAILAEREEE